MDKRVAIWNVLHDGEITAVSEDGDTLTMFVSIPYLRRRLAPLGDSFVLTLEHVTRNEFRDFDGITVRLIEELQNGSPEILSTDSEGMPVCIETTMGRLTLDFEGIRLAMDTGQEIAFEIIRHVCEDYWTEWEAKAEPDAPPKSRPPFPFPTSPDIQMPDSQRTPSSGGCG